MGVNLPEIGNITPYKSGPDRNRTCNYGFGDHRPIHWTTGPFYLSRRRKALGGRIGLGKQKAGKNIADRFQRISSAPKYGTSASGIRTEPSGCWYCSSSAT